MQKISVMLIVLFLFCTITIDSSANENDHCEENNTYVVWDGIKVNCISPHIAFRIKDGKLEIVSLDTPSKANMHIGHIEITNIDDFFKKMNDGFDRCNLVYKKDVIFLDHKSIEYKIQCDNNIKTWKGFLLPSLGYSISLMGNEEDFASLEDVLDHIELLPKQ